MDPARDGRSVGIQFGLLGTFEVLNNGLPVGVDGATDQSVLVALLLRPAGYVSAGQLIAAVWGEPGAIREDSLYHRISGLRRVLKPLGLRIGPDPAKGVRYGLRVPAAALDVNRFHDALAAARAVADGEPEEALRRFRAAVALWRGPQAFPALRLPGVRALGHALDLLRLDAEEKLAELEISLGDPETAHERLRDLTAAHPNHAGILAALIAVLRATGRQREAGELYAAARGRFRPHLPDKVERAFRRHAGHSPGPPAPPVPDWVPPAQLPHAARYFIGREAEFARLMRAPDPGAPRTVVVSAVNGMAGVGKTALVLRAAHRMIEAGWFPHGSLYVNLRGISDQAALAPGAALETLLRGLGVTAAGIPAGTDDRAALYRTILARRQVLVVLDNARDEAQVRPLLPGTLRSLVLVTSRRRLTGLDDADQVNLDVLAVPEAVALFREMIGPRESGDQDTIEEIVRLCGLLPLAVRIAAARLKATRALDGPWLLTQLRTEQGRLAMLDDGERSVKAALAVSVQHLPADQQRAFAALGLHPGIDFEPYAVAALLDTTAGQAYQVLDALEQVNLMDQPSPGRYQFHDLVRAYASSLAPTDVLEPGPALGRLYAFYARTASLAMGVAYPYGSAERPPAPVAASQAPPLGTPERAKGWLDAELANLVAAAHHAAVHGHPEHTLFQSGTLRSYLRTNGKYGSARDLDRRAVELARAAGDVPVELATLTALGHSYRLLGQYAAAVAAFEQALDLASRTDETAAMDPLAGLGHVHYRRGEHDLAMRCFSRALRLAQSAGNLRGAVDALTGLGSVHYMQGRLDQAADSYDQARKLAEAMEHRQGEFDAVLGLAYCVYHQGDLSRAAASFMRTLELARRLGSVLGEANAMAGLGHVARTGARYGSAARYYTRVLDLAGLSGDRFGQLSALVGLGHVYRLQGDTTRASRSYTEAIKLSAESGVRTFAFEVHLGLGHAHRAAGEPELAIDEYAVALDLARELGQPGDVILALDGMAHARWAVADHNAARDLWTDALNMLVRLGLPAVEGVSVDSLRACLEVDRRSDGADPVEWA
jgi:tetratricopeptide (TPR) repeat protein